MVTQHKERMILYATCATLGSLAGCLVLYYVGRKGGDAFVRTPFQSGTVDRTLAMVQAPRRHGDSDSVPAAAAGAVQDLRAAGRRGGHQHVALHHGDPDRPRRPLLRREGFSRSTTATRRIAFLNANGTKVFVGFIGLLAVGGAVYWWWSKSRAKVTP